MLTLNEIENAKHRIKDCVKTTPVITSGYIDKLVGRKVHFKCEHLQETGSFKDRSVINKIKRLQEDGGTLKGIVTHSTGNNGMALACIARQLDIPAIVVLSNNTVQYKTDAIESYGGRMVFCDGGPQECIEMCDRLAKENDYAIILPYDDNDVIAGHGTIGLEFLEQVPELDVILLPVGGGGLFAGIARAVKEQKETVKFYCVEPEGRNLEETLRNGVNNLSEFVDTIADGIRYCQTGVNTMPYLMKYSEKTVFTVNNDDIIKGTRKTFSHLKQVVEPTAGCCLEALIKYNHIIPPEMKNVGIVLSGGNIDIDNLPW